MKIDVLMASRGNAVKLMSVLTCFDQLSSGNHDITYRVVCDMDDPLTYQILGKVQLKIAVHCGQGPLHKRLNEAAMESDADVITGAADDTFPLAQHWDAIIDYGMSEGHHAFSWQEVNDPTNQTMIALSKKWIQSVGRFYPEYFPFWFADTWIAEVHEMIYHKPLPIVETLPWGGKRGQTRGMRELKYWFEFFQATRIERIAEARGLCFHLGIPFDPPEEMLADMWRRDAEQLARVPHYEMMFNANQGEPSERYLSMKTIADQWLQKEKEQLNG